MNTEILNFDELVKFEGGSCLGAAVLLGASFVGLVAGTATIVGVVAGGVGFVASFYNVAVEC